MESQYDLAVVGGSFAGLVCARAAAARGLRVVVLERKPELGAGVRTTGILVKEIADQFDFPKQHVRKIPGVRLYSPSMDYLDLRSPGYFFLATDTPELLRWLGRDAGSVGVEVRCGTGISELQETASGFALPEAGVETRFLVGADGARSGMARLLGFPMNRRFLLGVEQEWQDVEGIHPEYLHVFLDSQLAPGYIAWIVPGSRIFQIGLALNQRRAPRLDDFIGKLQAVFDFSSARLVGRRGGLIPVGGTLSQKFHPRAILLGDAAGTVSPLTAGGIHPAIETGRAAGVLLAAHLQDGGVHPAKILQGELPRYGAKMLLRFAADHLQPPNPLWNLLFRSTAFKTFAQTVFFHHRGLLSMAAWRDLLRMPEN